MKRRLFLKGLVVALVAPKILLTEKVEAAIPIRTVIPEDNTSVWMVNWGEESVNMIGPDMNDSIFYGDTATDPETFSGLAAKYK